ncbi:MAG: hypothetical protein KatS3mg132_590 [Limisphaera sp.]|nr:MAG: hypothetical protein KatS3mg132_590 [Limisphaera sp.]
MYALKSRGPRLANEPFRLNIPGRLRIMDIKLPPLGEGADSGVVVNVLVKPGDTVSPGQPLLELENEKAIATIPAEHAGTVVEVYVKPGEKVSVGQRILKLQTSAGAVPAETGASKPAESRRRAAKPAAPPPEEVEEPAEEAAAGVGHAVEEEEEEEEEAPRPVAAPVAPPSVRRLARELGIDLSKVRGYRPGRADHAAGFAQLHPAAAAHRGEVQAGRVAAVRAGCTSCRSSCRASSCRTGGLLQVGAGPARTPYHAA